MLNVPSVAMIDGSLRTRMITALKIPVANPTAISARPPGSNAHPDVSNVIVYEARTTQNVMSAATETSKPPTSSAQVCPSETRASGIVRRSRLLRLKLVRKAS